jgi:biopolymer transport protein ExbD
MAHAALDRDDSTITGINVTPLVDITLVLLIVFMITAKVVVSQAIPLQVPTASTPTAVQATLAVTVAADGSLALDGAPMPNGAALAAAVRSRAGTSAADMHAVIAASTTASHGAVVAAIDALRSAGVTKIAFAVHRAPPKK